MKGNRFWLLILGALVVLSVVALFIIQATKQSGEQVAIYQNGELLETLPLHQQQSLRIPAKNGGFNVVDIRDDAVQVTESSCPDQVCVRHGPTKETKNDIVCLPNRLVVKVIREQGQPLDGVTG